MRISMNVSRVASGLCAVVGPLEAQWNGWGVEIGDSFDGGSQRQIAVPPANGRLTGAAGAGLHLRAMLRLSGVRGSGGISLGAGILV